MKKIISTLILTYVTLFGYEYDNFLLKAQSNIFPKLVLLDKDISKNITNNEIVFCIVHHSSDNLKSMQIKNMLLDRYGKSIGRYKFKIVLKEFDEVFNGDDSDVYYILQGPHSMIEQVCDIAQNQHVPTFVYDFIYFNDGALISMTIENSSTIYLNKKVHKEYKINFVDIFYQTISLYDE